MAARTHTETERKYEFDGPGEPPVLQRIAGVAAVGEPRRDKLEAVYFDTADLRLLRRGTTLRRRTGGPDAGWHLKVPTGPDTREELREPLGGQRDKPPAALRKVIAGLVRGGRLRPVARLDTDRVTRELTGRDGRTLAELTDDTVTATTLSGPAAEAEWHELEVELAPGAPENVLDRVEKSLRRAGYRRGASPSKLARVLPVPAAPAPGTTAGGAVVAYLAAQVAVINGADVGIRHDAPHSVHRMRVGIRRLRSALRVYGRIVDRARTAELTAELRRLGRRLGPARDLEVQEAALRAALAGLPAELVPGPVSARLTRYFAPARAKARRRVLAELDGKRYRALLDELDRLVTDPPLTGRAARPAAEELPRHLRRAYRRTVRRLDAADGEGRDAALHRARRAAKRFRYAAEVAEPALGKPARRSRRRARELTRLLGEHQDGVVALPLLRDLAAQSFLAGENAFAFGVLHEREASRARDAERDLPRVRARFTASRAHRWS